MKKIQAFLDTLLFLSFVLFVGWLPLHLIADFGGKVGYELHFKDYREWRDMYAWLTGTGLFILAFTVFTVIADVLNKSKVANRKWPLPSNVIWMGFALFAGSVGLENLTKLLIWLERECPHELMFDISTYMAFIAGAVTFIGIFVGKTKTPKNDVKVITDVTPKNERKLIGR